MATTFSSSVLSGSKGDTTSIVIMRLPWHASPTSPSWVYIALFG